MFKKSMFCVALASLVLATSCSQDDLQTAKFSQNPIKSNVGLGGQPISTFAAAKGKAVKSRAVETTITNLGSFTMNAFQDGETNYMKDVKYTSTDGSVWNTDAGTFYWPVEGNLHFYAYAPEQPGQAGTFKLDKDAQTLTDFVPNTAAADQKDFVYAKSTGNNKANGTTGIDIDFQHALSEVTIAAKNENTAYTVDVTGVKIGNVIKKGTFTFPSTSDAAASWTLSSDVSDVTDYTTTWTTPVTLGSDVSTLDAQSTTIHLYKEGIFWKAYEYSAYRFVFGILKCKPKKQCFKETSTEMIHIGFPLTSLDTHQDSFRLISKDENTCTIEPVDFLPQMTFEEWKNSIETTVSNNKGANLMLPKGTSPTDEYIINKVRSFNIESKTPMDCMMFLVDLKKKINGEV